MTGARASAVTIAIDTGGTFTDVVCLARGQLHVLKLPSTPADPADAVLAGIAAVLRLAGAEGEPFTLVHGSTVATNALLERRGARVALVTNRGFEDVIEIGRQDRPQLYALAGTRPPPLVARDARIGIAGRIGPDGQELEPLDDAELAALAERVRGAQAVAVSMLHAYAEPAHEERVAAALEPTGLPVSVSSRLLPEFREYERTATTVVNAYVAPVAGRYLGRIEREAGAARVRIMGSAGGALPVARARREPVHTVLSGPAGGVIGALDAAAATGITNVLTFDMGGTSTDVSLCAGGPRQTREFRIGGLPVAVPVLDIHTVGAGGGSIARLDAAGALRVGPESAGAVPGPICYGRGGTDVTVTDANVWLGLLPAIGWRHGGPGPHGPGRAGPGLDRDAIAPPLHRLAAALGTSPDAAAEGVIAVANTAMEGALRVISVERGHDPADFTLVAFGGAAGLHALELAERLGVSHVLFPAAPGVLSALGMLSAPVRKDASRTVLIAARESRDADLEPAFSNLERTVRDAMREEGFPPGGFSLTRRIDARYHGQSWELTVPAGDWVAAFHDAHRRRYGYAREGAAVEAVTLRVHAEAAVHRPDRAPLPARTGERPAPITRASAYFEGGRHNVPAYDRATLRAGDTINGPAIITEYTATFWLRPGWRLEVQSCGGLLARCARTPDAPHTPGPAT